MCNSKLYGSNKHKWITVHDGEEIEVCGRCYILVKILEALGEETPNGNN